MPADIAQARNREPIIQFSVFADNKVGRLNELVQLLSSDDIHILAISLQDTTESTIMRLVVNYPKQARDLLTKEDYSFTEVQVIGVELDRADQLKVVAAALVEAEINIHYLYPFVTRPGGKSGMVLSLEDNDLAAHIMSCHGLRVLDQNDIAR